MAFTNPLKEILPPPLGRQLGYSDQDILLIVNIDDLGMHRDITGAGISAFDFGLVKSGSIMVPCPDREAVYAWWRQNPTASIGVHLTLNAECGQGYSWRPILPQSDVPSLYNENGMMWESNESLLTHAHKEDVERELEAQITTVLDEGLQPSHLDYHMNFHNHMDLLSTIVALSHKYSLPLRIPRRRKYRVPFVKNNIYALRRQGHIFPDTQLGLYKRGIENLDFDAWKATYHNYLRSLKPGVHSINVHIGFATPALRSISGIGDSTIRQFDYDVWISDETKGLAEELGIIFIGYRPLQKLQKTAQKQ